MAATTKVVLKRTTVGGVLGYRIDSIHGNTNIVSFISDYVIRDARVGEFVTDAEADKMTTRTRYDVTSKA